MEYTDIRARVAEVGAPKGGWPNLGTQMTEVRFFLQQGQLDEAYELLSILQQRYPGHPDLADFARAGTNRKADADVESLVDSVLASSASLAGKAVRRRATRWDAPTVGKREPTSVQDPVDLDAEDEEMQTIVKPPREAPVDLTHEAKPVRERTTVYRAVAPKQPPRSGMTIAVDALQPASPFIEPNQPSNTEAQPTVDARDTSRDSVKLKARKRSLTSRKRKVDGRASRRGVAFGAGVLGRFGR